MKSVRIKSVFCAAFISGAAFFGAVFAATLLSPQAVLAQTAVPDNPKADVAPPPPPATPTSPPAPASPPATTTPSAPPPAAPPAPETIAVFVETDDNGFGYEAMVPLTEKPEGKDQLGSDVKLGSSPSGKAIKFQHRGAYDDIDSTYDLITAYLDEKGLEAQNLFIEEYLTDTKNSDDQGLQVDIYVFIK